MLSRAPRKDVPAETPIGHCLRSAEHRSPVVHQAGSCAIHNAGYGRCLSVDLRVGRNREDFAPDVTSAADAAAERTRSGLQWAEVHNNTLRGQLAVVVEAVESDERQFHFAPRRCEAEKLV